MTRTGTRLLAAVVLVLSCLSCSRSAPSSIRPSTADRAAPPGADGGFPEGLPEEALPRLMRWLESDRYDSTRWPSRDIFQKGPAGSSPAPAEPSRPSQSLDAEEPAAIEPPRLTGFIFSGGTVAQPLAAIDLEGRMWLAGVGDVVGPFRVAAMIVGEEVELVDQESGESLRLTIR